MTTLAILAALIVADVVLSIATFRPRPSRWVSVLAVVCGVASLALSVVVLMGGSIG